MLKSRFIVVLLSGAAALFSQALPAAGPDPCKTTVDPSSYIGEIPGITRDDTDQLKRMRAERALRFEIAPDAQLATTTSAPVPFIDGKPVAANRMQAESALKALAKGHASLQLCSVTFKRIGFNAQTLVKLSDLDIRYRGALHMMDEYEVTINGKSYKKNKNAKATLRLASDPRVPPDKAFEIVVQCENIKGDEPLTYLTVQNALGVALLPYLPSQAPECTVKPDSSSKLVPADTTKSKIKIPTDSTKAKPPTSPATQPAR